MGAAKKEKKERKENLAEVNDRHARRMLHYVRELVTACSPAILCPL